MEKEMKDGQVKTPSALRAGVSVWIDSLSREMLETASSRG